MQWHIAGVQTLGGHRYHGGGGTVTQWMNVNYHQGH